jgi:hypothetical protein
LSYFKGAKKAKKLNMRRDMHPEELRRLKEEETETVLRDHSFLLFILFLHLQIVLDPLRTFDERNMGGGSLNGWR